MSFNLGLLEEMILLVILKEGETNGAEIVRIYETSFKRSISLPAVVVVLKRLEKKGMLKSRMGEATPERGGKPKRMYQATQMGYNVALEIQQSRNQMWETIPAYRP